VTTLGGLAADSRRGARRTSFRRDTAARAVTKICDDGYAG